eukprot:scaffold1504_cov172-Ochromonas_danica.AAC.4
MIVTYCAAGDAHSAVLTIGRNVPGKQFPKILTFGRGAHGRLGNGTNKNLCTPVLVKTFPESLMQAELQFISVACGGAHTIALAYVVRASSLAFPFGIQSVILAWGYGANGQLGHGKRIHEFLPVQTRMINKAEVIVEIAAGRSWSLARTLGGGLYSWGKGLRGQLGQGHQKALFSLAPRPVDCFGAFLALSAQFQHNIGLVINKKDFNLSMIEKKYAYHVKEQKKRKEELIKVNEMSTTPWLRSKVQEEEEDQEDMDIFRYHERYLRLAPLRSRALYEIGCCKRVSYSQQQTMESGGGFRERLRYHCRSCHLDYLCLSCVLLCHAGHDVILSTAAIQQEQQRQQQAARGEKEGGKKEGTVDAASTTAVKGGGEGKKSRDHTPLKSSGKGSRRSKSPHKGASFSSAHSASTASTSSTTTSRSKNPLENIFIRTDSLQYDDRFLDMDGKSLLPHHLVAAEVSTVLRRLEGEGAGTEGSRKKKQYLERGSLVFPRQCRKTHLPINIHRNGFMDYYSEKIEYKAMRRKVADDARLRYELKYMERYPDPLPLYEKLIHNIQKRIVKKDKEKIRNALMRSDRKGSQETSVGGGGGSGNGSGTGFKISKLGKKGKKASSRPPPAGSSGGGGGSNKTSLSSAPIPPAPASSTFATSQSTIQSINSSSSFIHHDPSQWSSNAFSSMSSLLSMTQSSSQTSTAMAHWLNVYMNQHGLMVPACHCALYHPGCKLLPNIPEVEDEYVLPSFLSSSASSSALSPHRKEGNTEKTKTLSRSISHTSREKGLIPTLRSSVDEDFGVGANSSSSGIGKQPMAISTITNPHYKEALAIHLEDEKIMDLHRHIRVFYDTYATKIQRIVKRYIHKCRFIKLHKTLQAIRRQVVVDHVEKAIFRPVWNKVKRIYSTYREDVERKDMAYEDALTHKYNKYKKLQKTMMAIKVLQAGMKYWYSKASIHYPVIPTGGEEEGGFGIKPFASRSFYGQSTNQLMMLAGGGGEDDYIKSELHLLHHIGPAISQYPSAAIATSSTSPNQPSPTSLAPFPLISRMQSSWSLGSISSWGDSLEAMEVMVPSFAFSWISLRAQQLLLHARDRLHARTLATLAQSYPIDCYHEGRYYDLDIYENFLKVFLQSKPALYQKLRRYEKALNSVRTTAVRAEEALRRLKMKQPMKATVPNAVNPFAKPPSAGKTNNLANKLMSRNAPIVRYKLDYVNVYLEELMIFRNVVNADFNYAIKKILDIYKNGYAVPSHYLEIVQHIPDAAMRLTTNAYNRFLEYLISLLDHAHAQRLHAIQVMKEEEEARRREEEMKAKELEEIVKSQKKAASNRFRVGLFAKYATTKKGSPAQPAAAPTGANTNNKPTSASQKIGGGTNSNNNSKPGTANGERIGSSGGSNVVTMPIGGFAPQNSGHQAVVQALQDPQRKLPNPLINPMKRRHSIGDPSYLYRRSLAAVPVMHHQSLHRRRPSEPASFFRLYLRVYKGYEENIREIKKSLALFDIRYQALADLRKEYTKFFAKEAERAVKRAFELSQAQAPSAMTMSGKSGVSKSSTASGHASKRQYLWLMYSREIRKAAIFSPRLPVDINALLTSPNRRRTIAEPERLYRQLTLQYKSREDFAEVINLTNENYSLCRHKRSFDLGEILDEEHGLMEELDFGFNEYCQDASVITNELYNTTTYDILDTLKQANAPRSPGKLTSFQRMVKSQTAEFKADVQYIDQRMIVMGYTEASEEIIALTRARLAETKRMKTLQAQFGTQGDDAQQKDSISAMERLSDKINGVGSGSITSNSLGSAKKKRRRNGTSGKLRRNSFIKASVPFGGDDVSLLSMDHSEDGRSVGGKEGQFPIPKHFYMPQQANQRVEVWQIYYTDEGHEYYYNPENGQTTWLAPAESTYIDEYGQTVEVQYESQYNDDQGLPYWYNHNTQESRYA